jgi:hypothetical protein
MDNTHAPPPPHTQSRLLGTVLYARQRIFNDQSFNLTFEERNERGQIAKESLAPAKNKSEYVEHQYNEARYAVYSLKSYINYVIFF